MATANQNLSEHDDSHLPDISQRCFSIVTAEWNHEITQPLLDGTIATLLKYGAKEKNIRTKWVPGSFELSLGAQWEAARPKVDTVICLGCVVQG
ncbi:MAG: 6,7-dimethyl-8-ribityllumazine synthase, partial [Tunicatimonas sp.]|uniref:6,7-dimethyl-8-ribityllumazine synthase n=1 Tax=Tunicatimonas sp. TaxID=1940096 RepID=UPI003C743FAD